MSLREEIVELLLQYEGVCPTHKREEYKDLLTRGGQETATMAEAMMRMSSCALTIRGIWYKLGVRHKRLNEPYQNGMAPRDVLEIGKYFGATVDGYELGSLQEGELLHPKAGDSYYVLFPGSGKGEHFGTIVDLKEFSADTLEFESIDGGQDNGGIKRVHCCFKRCRPWWIGAKSGKSLFYWFDADKLVRATDEQG